MSAWQWAVLGIILMMTELAVPAFFILWFGLGALLVALLLWVMPELSLSTQILLWTVSSAALTGLWFYIFKSSFQKTRSGLSDAQAIGEIGLLVKETEAFKRGQVRFQKPLLGSDVWECIADETIAVGERVKVVSIEGNMLKVTKS
jgi:membrane protein implicated in regulation of membrane protease activity